MHCFDILFHLPQQNVIYITHVLHFDE